MLAIHRRIGVLFVVALCAGAIGPARLMGAGTPTGDQVMHGLIGKMTAVEGKRDELISILLHGSGEMPGCLSYVVAKDVADSNAIWVTEVWQDEASHKASLTLPAVRDAIAKGKPMIAKFDQFVITQPMGGHGLPSADAGYDVTDAALSDHKAMAGKWFCVSAEKNGNRLTVEQFAEVTLFCDGNGRATVIKRDEVLFSGTFKLDPTKSPKALDATPTPDAAAGSAAIVYGIYRVDGDVLTLCSAEPGVLSRPTEFVSAPGSGHFLRKFKREIQIPRSPKN